MFGGGFVGLVGLVLLVIFLVRRGRSRRQLQGWGGPQAGYGVGPGGYPPPQPGYGYPPPAPYATAAPPGAPVAAGQRCQPYQSTVVIDGRPQQTQGTACLQPDGTWRITR